MRISNFDGGSPYRLDGLLFLRGIAAFTVVVHHLQIGAALAALSGVAILGGLAVTGSYSVHVFFCLSGYLMVKIIDRHYEEAGFRAFYLNRGFRIVPVYYMAVGATVLLAGNPGPDALLPVLGFYYNYDFNAVFPNVPLWTISTEVQFYLLCPLLYLVERRFPHAAAAAFVLSLGVKAAYFAVYQANVTEHHEIYMGLETNLIFFMTGWMAYRYRDRLPALPGAVALGGGLLLLLALWGGHWLYVDNTVEGLYRSPLWIFVFPLLLCTVMLVLLPSIDRGVDIGGNREAWKRRAMGGLAFLGVTSYSAYVLHTALIPRFDMPPYLKLVAIYAVVALVYAMFEAPIYRLRRRLARRFVRRQHG